LAAVTDLFTSEAVVAFIQVVAIDLVLAADNAIVIGLAAAGLPPDRRTRAILIGIVGATILRIVFAGLTTQLLQIVGLLFAGGILLLWVCWKIWRELRTKSVTNLDGVATHGNWAIKCDGTIARRARRKTLGQAALQIVAADVSMSLDNVLAVAGAAREHPIVLVFGLLLSIALMGVAANWVARLLQKHRWIAYVGLAIIFYVACEMIYRGAHELKPIIKMASILPE
jgi:YjbE family integral membrane protein